MVDNDEIVVLADVTKQFFVSMLTRDISAQDAIFDLIDNSIDSAIRLYDLNVMNTLLGGSVGEKVDCEVRITFDNTRFKIEDNCGGISREEAKTKVFVFGRKPDVSGSSDDVPGLSVYGIGMKRAFFKIGSYIELCSRTKGEEEYGIPWDVDAWTADTTGDWDLRFANPDVLETKIPSGVTGTTINISRLLPEIQKLFATERFTSTLRDKIGSIYGLFIRAGIRVYVNEKEISATLPQIASGADLVPAQTQFSYNSEVDVYIVVGTTEKNDKNAHGWYVFCNGRLVLEADKTFVTGWGNGLAKWHTKYNHFIGLCYFRSNSEASLPWTTTKHTLNYEAGVYRKALGEMCTLGKPVTRFLGKMYPAQDKLLPVPEKVLFESTQSVGVETLAPKSIGFTFSLPTTPEPQETSITFVRPTPQVRQVKEKIGDPEMLDEKVGEYVFDYYVARHLNV